ncbi:hypothetical protein PAEPH01_1480, partial [Pancytospora epiphaga]
SEFEAMKDTLRGMQELALPNYNKPFMLRSDASNLGLGAVLLQMNVADEWVLIQWASKTLIPTKKRYVISEKEMLAVFRGVKKFEYELRGQKFTLVTNHKALEEIRKKPYFENNQINKWIEKIQEFDFEVIYQKGGEMVVSDSLSRLSETDDKEKKKEVCNEKNLRDENIKKNR